jgi:hypothetical protein
MVEIAIVQTPYVHRPLHTLKLNNNQKLILKLFKKLIFKIRTVEFYKTNLKSENDKILCYNVNFMQFSFEINYDSGIYTLDINYF